MLLNSLNLTHQASRKIAHLSTIEKNQILAQIAYNLNQQRAEILEANAQDIRLGETKKLGNILDRILLTSERIDGIIGEIKNIIELEDQIGKILEHTVRPNGLKIKRVRTPLGVVLMIYEARPNVTIDATVLALKSGNAVILKGGSDALNSNRALVKVIHQSLIELNLPTEIVHFIDSADRTILSELLQVKQYIDVVIPRGGKGLIDFVIQKSLIPVIETGASVVHTYLDLSADFKKAVEIIVNAKTRRVSVCNALDILLVHQKEIERFLPLLIQAFQDLQIQQNLPLVEIRADKTSFKILEKTNYTNLKAIQNTDYDTEFLDYILGIKVVDSLEEAIAHINQHSLKHSEAILTENAQNATKFLQEIDAACVYHNTSTAFSDGAQFGLGAEIGISTQKLHTRGPFALEGLCSYKWIIEGDGQTRP